MNNLSNLILIGTLMLMYSCSKENENDTASKTQRVKEIIYNKENGKNDKVIFTYLFDGKPSRRIRSNGNTMIRSIIYNGDQIVEISLHSNPGSNNLIIDSDSELLELSILKHDSQGRIDSIFKTNYVGGSHYKDLIIYEYDFLNNIVGLKLYDAYTNRKTYSEIHVWEDGNIIQTQYFDADDCLLSEEFYTYDDKLNFQISDFWTNPSAENFSKNNVVQFSTRDNCWFIDYWCQPCNNRYQYNQQDLPIIKDDYSNQNIEIFYE